MKQYVCTACHYLGRPGKKKRGSGKVEMFCWAVFPLGVPYTIWRMVTKINICKQCEKETVVDSESAVGVRIMEKIDEDLIAAIAGAAGSSPVVLPKPTKPVVVEEDNTPKPPPQRARPPTPNYDPNW